MTPNWHRGRKKKFVSRCQRFKIGLYNIRGFWFRIVQFALAELIWKMTEIDVISEIIEIGFDLFLNFEWFKLALLDKRCTFNLLSTTLEKNSKTLVLLVFNWVNVRTFFCYFCGKYNIIRNIIDVVKIYFKLIWRLWSSLHD